MISPTCLLDKPVSCPDLTPEYEPAYDPKYDPDYENPEYEEGIVWLLPRKERRCDLGAACLCRKAGWQGECIREVMNRRYENGRKVA